MIITIITAMTQSGVIGKGNALPWNIPNEMKHFKNTTTNSTVIMGRKTFESIGKPLPNRNNIILSTPDLVVPNAHVCSSIEDALNIAQSFNQEVFIIGGAQTYAQFLPIAQRMIISYIEHDYEGDVFFPKWNQDDWKITNCIKLQEFKIISYQRHTQ